MTSSDLRYFEDLEEGETIDCGSIEMTKEEMLEFAERVDKHAGNNPSFGHTKAKVTTTNGHETTVLTMYGLGLVEKRDAP
jgi:hypothetical protein